MEVSGEAADLVMKESVQISEEAIKLLARGAKNLAALLYALAKDQKKLYGKVNMNRLLSEQRPIEVLPLRTEDFDDFKRRAKKVGLLFSTILDKKGDAPYLEILTNIDHLSQANYILEQMGYQPKQLADAQPKKEQTPARPEPSLQKQRSGLTQGPISTNEEKQPVRGRLAALRAVAERTRPEPPARAGAYQVIGVSIILNLADLVNEKNQSSELWQAQRQADRENTNAMQDAGIVQITSDPDAYLRYLNCQADNPSYSAGNVALVMVQDQDATIFGTKDRWKSLMRSVSPTEEKNGVKIYTRSSFGKGYVLTDVYDVRQTSGRDLKHTALQPDSKEMTEALKTLLNYCVVPLVSDESIPMPALYDPNQMKMAVNPKYNDAEAFAGIATEIAHVRFHAKGYNQNYSREDYELDAQSVGYMICRRFGVPCEAPDVSNLAAFYDGFEPLDRRQALGQIQDMAQKIGGSIERAITPQVRSRNMNRSAR